MSSTEVSAPPVVKGKGAAEKYREILLAVAFFLVFDLAVLVLNFYISFQITEDATAINLAGRQRMLTQRMAKSVYSLESYFTAGALDPATIDELRKTLTLFDKTLESFDKGGAVTGGDGKPANLRAVSTEAGRALMDQTLPLWAEYRAALVPLLGPAIDTPIITAAVIAARSNNLKLLGLMNDLTNHLEQVANAKANRLRWVQTIGIFLALINFGFILFKFIRKLRENDRKIEAAQNETTEILDTVKEGLFLLDANFQIGSQYSASLPGILGRPIKPGMNFLQLLQHMMPAPVYSNAKDYIELLLGNRVKENLVQELNPLVAVEVAISKIGGSFEARYLTLQFNRVMLHGQVQHLLVTVFDVTTQVELERKLAQAKQKSRTEVAMMLDVLKVSPSVLTQFLADAEKTMLEINDHLRSTGSQRIDYRRMIDTVFRKIHTLKGDAATLGLEMFEELAQQFETVLLPLRAEKNVSGDDLLTLPMPLDEILASIGAVRGLLERLSSYQYEAAVVTDADTFCDQLRQLAHRIAADHGKQVLVQADLTLLDALPVPMRKEIKDISVQLLRNAIVHGIEVSQERSALAKGQAGLIQLSLHAQEEGEYELLFRDDGQGISPDKVRTALIRAGLYTERQLEELDDRTVLLKIFEPGVSTATTSSRDAGHGVGMDVVRQKIQQLGASLRVATRPNAYTQFSILFNI